MIRQRAGERSSLIGRIDRVVSSILALAFLFTGFQTGYRLTLGGHAAPSPVEWTLRPESPVHTPVVPLDTPVPAREPLPMWKGTERINILVMGLDQRAGSGLPGRADVIMIANVDPVQNRVVLLSIPRDLWVEIPGHGESRINSAYFYGEFERAEGGGPELMKETIEHNFGLSIDYYGAMDFQCFKRIIDVLGGITVDVPQDIRDDQYPDDSYGYMRLFIPAGRQQMNGETALQYVRARHESSDFSRMRRQQQVLLAVREKALRLDIILSIPDLIPLMGEAFSTDVDLQGLLALANMGTGIRFEDIETYFIDESLTIPYVTPDGAQVLLPRMDQIQALISQAFDHSPQITVGDTSETTEANILVRADASRPGLAVSVADLLQRRGYNAQAESYGVQIECESTFIACSRQAAEMAVLVGALLHLDPEFVMLDSSAQQDMEMVVTLGRDFVMPE
ncbi:MAG: LCP family protein [Anaerolineae bacterium]|nr:LCP family protein [Anaerolineae bacterium]